MHKLLERQIRRYLAAVGPLGREFADFFAAIDAAYHENDADRGLLERSMELTSGELFERNMQLERELDAVKRLEVELRQAEKLRAVGQLAAGVAHEINTPIQYVGDSIHFMKDGVRDLLSLGQRLRDAPSDAADANGVLESLRAAAEEVDLEYLNEELPKALEQASDGLKRVAAIVSAMKDFGRPDSREKTLADVNHCLESSLLVAQNELKYVADAELDLGEIPPIPCYPGELNQVFLNLLVNAAHAVAARHAASHERGHVRVATTVAQGCVVVTISDDGSGISPEHQNRVFEPFFTTKALGAGTGQGLAIARSIVVEKHGGALTFCTTPGEGTTFFVSLPMAEVKTKLVQARNSGGPVAS